jgi:hypothetical protein
MPPKVLVTTPLTAVLTLGLGLGGDTSMRDNDL